MHWNPLEKIPVSVDDSGQKKRTGYIHLCSDFCSYVTTSYRLLGALYRKIKNLSSENKRIKKIKKQKEREEQILEIKKRERQL